MYDICMPFTRRKLSDVDPTTVRAVVEYNANRYFTAKKPDHKIERIARSYGATDLGAGMGFGVRDMEFDGFKSRKGIRSFVKKIKALKCKVVLYDEPNDAVVRLR